MRPYLVFFVFIALLTAWQVQAEDDVAQALAAFGLSPEQFSQDPDSGLLHASTAFASYYLSADKRYLLKGQMRRLDDKPRPELETTDIRPFKALEAQMITAADGDAKQTIYVFIDADCIHCRYLHAQRQQLEALGLTVKYLAYPLQGPDSLGFDKLKAAWCAADPLAAVSRLMADGSISGGDCGVDLSAQLRLGDSIGIGGLPTMVLPDGQILRGRRTALDIHKSLVSNALLRAHRLEHLIPLRHWQLRSLTPSPLSGWLQAEGGYHFFYLEQHGRALFMGDILDLHVQGQNLSELARQALRSEAIREFEGTMLTYRARAETQRLYAFTNLDCEPCQALHQAIPTLNASGVSVSLLALPDDIRELYQTRYAQAWCQGLPDLAPGADAELLAPARCDLAEQLKEHSYFAYRMGAALAPTIMLSDGQWLRFSDAQSLLRQLGLSR